MYMYICHLETSLSRPRGGLMVLGKVRIQFRSRFKFDFRLKFKLKAALSGVRQLLATESSLKMMKNDFISP